jgi:hypothetical protein
VLRNLTVTVHGYAFGPRGLLLPAARQLTASTGQVWRSFVLMIHPESPTTTLT